jgi:magnesium and cobalt exporter, CNNM family
MLVEILIIFLLVIANGIFAMAEMAIVSSRKALLRERAEGGDAGAQVALELATNPNKLLSTVQIGITLVGTFAGAFGATAISDLTETRQP